SDGSSTNLRRKLNGEVEALFLEDQYRLARWLTLNGGVRLTHFSGSLSENAANPRVGAAIPIPRLGWVLRGSYGRYYHAPPPVPASGAVLATTQEFLPLKGE